MTGMHDESMTAEEFDALTAAGTPVALNVVLARTRPLFTVKFHTGAGVARPPARLSEVQQVGAALPVPVDA